MSQTKRPGIKTVTRAGPGSYETTTRPASKGQTITKSKRQLLRVSSEAPGPGSYHKEEPKPKTRSNKFSSASIRQISKSYSPGVCKYDVKPVVDNAPMYTIPERREQRFEKNPGPGSYNIANLANYLKSKSASYSMPKARSQSPVNKTNNLQVPGPGSYHREIAPGEESPSARIIPNRKSEIQLSPGPGDYDPKDSTGSINTRLSRMERQLHEINQNPGPG